MFLWSVLPTCPTVAQAFHQHPAYLAGGEAYEHVGLFPGQDLGANSGSTDQLSTPAGSDLQVMHYGARRNIPEGQAVPRCDLGAGPRLDLPSHL